MKILILGGTGRISSAVVNKFIVRENVIWVLNRGYRQQIVGSHFIKCDVNDYTQLYKVLSNSKFDIIIDFLGYQVNDIEVKVNLFSLCEIKKYVFISSATVYDTSSSYIVNELSEVGNRFSQYASDKIQCERYLLKKWKEEHFPCVIIRPSQTYNEFSVPIGVRGKKGSWQNIKRIIEGKQVIIHGDGNTMWTATRSIDFAEWLLDIVETEGLEGEIIQVTCDESMTWNEIYGVIADELGKKLYAIYIPGSCLAKLGKKFNLEEMILGDKGRNIIFDNSKLKRISSYHPKVSMEFGIRDSVRYLLNHKEYQYEDMEFEIWCDQICAEKGKDNFLNVGMR